MGTEVAVAAQQAVMWLEHAGWPISCMENGDIVGVLLSSFPCDPASGLCGDPA
jgi:hypothetical protein